MQDRYTGDIGDFVKYGLLRALSPGYRLGVAWYLYPDEGHDAAGKHISYLEQPARWRHRDTELFDGLRQIVASGKRKVAAVEQSGLLGNAAFATEPLAFHSASIPARHRLRQGWFEEALRAIASCDLVFADPDNGLCDDDAFSHARTKDWKRLPMTEAKILASNRTAILYHHNTRRPGGHILEIEHWRGELGPGTAALRWRAYSNRTFFVVNPTDVIRQRLHDFAKRWAPEAELHD